jgi:hypothetical protein
LIRSLLVFGIILIAGFSLHVYRDVDHRASATTTTEGKRAPAFRSDHSRAELHQHFAPTPERVPHCSDQPRPRPADPDPIWMGNSVGLWEGDTLAVDCIGFNERTEVNGYHHTEALHTVELFRRPEAASLPYEVTIEDSNVFVRPWTENRIFALRPELEKIHEFVCENSRGQRPSVQFSGRTGV